MIRYRTESFSGMGYRQAAAVMAFETFCLGNTDILDYLADGPLSETPIAEKLRSLSAEITEDGSNHDDPSSDDIGFMESVLTTLADATGITVRYALWLTDRQTLERLYGKDMQDPCDYDAYETGPVILSDLGYDGALYGYAEIPQPLKDEKTPIIFSGEDWG